MRRLLKGATLSAERLRELLHYDPETGTFTWLRTVSRTEAGNAVAGNINASTGYRISFVDRCRFKAHRLAYLWMTGAWPLGSA